MKPTTNNEQLGQAYRAWEAYNWKQKHGRLGSFDLKRWLKVVRAIESTNQVAPIKRQKKLPPVGKTPEERRAYMRAWYARDKGKIRPYNKKRNGEANP